MSEQLLPTSNVFPIRQNLDKLHLSSRDIYPCLQNFIRVLSNFTQSTKPNYSARNRSVTSCFLKEITDSGLPITDILKLTSAIHFPLNVCTMRHIGSTNIARISKHIPQRLLSRFRSFDRSTKGSTFEILKKILIFCDSDWKCNADKLSSKSQTASDSIHRLSCMLTSKPDQSTPDYKVFLYNTIQYNT